MTLPTVINNAQDRQFKAMFKKQYSTIAQALQMVYAKDGENLDLGNLFSTATYIKVMQPFICKLGQELKYLKAGVICTDENMSAVMVGNTKFNEDITWHKNDQWFNKKKEPMRLNQGYKNFTFLLPDGALINFNCWKTVFIDVNGYKKPNTIGRDIFYFGLTQNNYSPVFFDYASGNNINGCTSGYQTVITKDNYKEDCETGSGWGCSPLYIME